MSYVFIHHFKIKHYGFSVELLSTVSDCDALIAIATKKRGDLDFKRLTLVRKQSVSSTTAASIESEIASVTAELANYVTQLETLPEGSYREDVLDKQYRAQYRLYTLNARKNATGARAVSQQAYDIDCVDVTITQNEAFIAALNARKAAL